MTCTLTIDGAAFRYEIPDMWLLSAARQTGSTIDAVRQWHTQAQLEAQFEAQKIQDAALPIDGASLRQFSSCGPCIKIGTVISHTAKTVTFVSKYTGEQKRKGGYYWIGNGETPLGQNLLHTVPCQSCEDHARTQYPHGYMD